MSEYQTEEYECRQCGPFVIVKSSFIGGPDVNACPECGLAVSEVGGE